MLPRSGAFDLISEARARLVRRAISGGLIALVVAMPVSAFANAPDAGRAKDSAVAAPVVEGRGRQRGTREQAKFALVLVAGAVGVYVLYRMVRR